MSQSFYQILGLDPSATPKDIERAYKRQALLYHPDRNRDPSATADFQKLLEAYQTLNDPIKRIGYDAKLRRPNPHRSRTNPPPPPPPSPPPFSFNPRPPKPTRSSTTPLHQTTTTTTTTNSRTPLSSAYTKTPTSAYRPKQSKTFYANRRPASADPDSTSSSFFSGLFTSAPPTAEPKTPKRERKPTEKEIPKPTTTTTGSPILDEFMSSKFTSERLHKLFADLDLQAETPQAPTPNVFMYSNPTPKRPPRSTSARAEPNVFPYAGPPGSKGTSKPTEIPKTYTYKFEESRKPPRATTTTEFTTSKLHETLPKTSREESVRSRTRDHDQNRPSGHRRPSSTTVDHGANRRSAESSYHHTPFRTFCEEYSSSREIVEDDVDLYGVQWPPVRQRAPRASRPSVDTDQGSSRVEEWVKSSGSFRTQR